MNVERKSNGVNLAVDSCYSLPLFLTASSFMMHQKPVIQMNSPSNCVNTPQLSLLPLENATSSAA